MRGDLATQKEGEHPTTGLTLPRHPGMGWRRGHPRGAATVRIGVLGGVVKWTKCRTNAGRKVSLPVQRTFNPLFYPVYSVGVDIPLTYWPVSALCCKDYSNST